MRCLVNSGLIAKVVVLLYKGDTIWIGNDAGPVRTKVQLQK